MITELDLKCIKDTLSLICPSTGWKVRRQPLKFEDDNIIMFYARKSISTAYSNYTVPNYILYNIKYNKFSDLFDEYIETPNYFCVVTAFDKSKGEVQKIRKSDFEVVRKEPVCDAIIRHRTLKEYYGQLLYDNRQRYSDKMQYKVINMFNDDVPFRTVANVEPTHRVVSLNDYTKLDTITKTVYKVNPDDMQVVSTYDIFDKTRYNLFALSNNTLNENTLPNNIYLILIYDNVQGEAYLYSSNTHKLHRVELHNYITTEELLSLVKRCLKMTDEERIEKYNYTKHKSKTAVMSEDVIEAERKQSEYITLAIQCMGCNALELINTQKTEDNHKSRYILKSLSKNVREDSIWATLGIEDALIRATNANKLGIYARYDLRYSDLTKLENAIFDRKDIHRNSIHSKNESPEVKDILALINLPTPFMLKLSDKVKEAVNGDLRLEVKEETVEIPGVLLGTQEFEDILNKKEGIVNEA